MDAAPLTRTLRLAKALSDPGRLRALMLLEDHELCVCQLIGVLGLAPSTVSGHMRLLHEAGLVARRKQARWHYYRLAGRTAPADVREALRWVRRTLCDDDTVRADRKRLARVRRMELSEVSACYPAT